MGNAPSNAELPPDWADILPYITREDIVRSSRKKCRLDEGNRVYLDEDMFDLDEHVPVATAVLGAHPQLKDVRFKLVPGRMTEEMFWAAIFGILNDGGIDMEDLVGTIDDDYETGDEVDGNGSRETGEGEILLSPVAQGPPTKGKSMRKEKGKLIRSPIAHLEQAYFDSGDASESSTLLEQIEAQQAHIARLQKSLRQANHKTRKLALELHKERTKDLGEGAGCQKSNSSRPPKRSHKGSWEMNSDCSEFMKLDDHLKENLRQEKAKRLNEVQSQMKFILDSDDIKDSYGRWKCCGKETYDIEGCA